MAVPIMFSVFALGVAICREYEDIVRTTGLLFFGLLKALLPLHLLMLAIFLPLIAFGGLETFGDAREREILAKLQNMQLAYVANTLKVQLSGLDAETIQLEQLERILVGQYRFNNDCVDIGKLCRIVVTDKFNSDYLTAIVITRDSESRVFVEWYSYIASKWIYDNQHLRQPASLMVMPSAEALDNLIEKIDQGELPIIPVEVNMLSIGGGEFITPYVERYKQ